MHDLNTKIAILILFFEKPGQTIECIKSFIPSGCKIYLLNNGSSENATKKVEKFISEINHVSYFKLEKNLGPAGGRNKLIIESTEEWLFLVDSDITVSPGNWIELFDRENKNDPGTDIFLPELYNVHEKSYAIHPLFVNENNHIKIKPDEVKRINYFPSGASIVRRKVLNVNNLFDPNLHGFEDYEFAIRNLVSGEKYKIHKIKSIMLKHDHRFANSQDDKNAIKTRYSQEKLSNSFKYIEQKFNITFEHEWEWWNKKQIYEMTQKSLWTELKRKIYRLIFKYS